MELLLLSDSEQHSKIQKWIPQPTNLRSPTLSICELDYSIALTLVLSMHAANNRTTSMQQGKKTTRQQCKKHKGDNGSSKNCA